MERQDLIEKLKLHIGDLQSSPLYHFQYELAEVCLHFLRDETMERGKTQGDAFFFNVMLPRVELFSWAKTERGFIVTELLRWLVASISLRFLDNLIHEESTHSQKSFQAETPAI